MFDKIIKEKKEQPPIVFFPLKYEDLDKIIASLKLGHSVIVNVKNMDEKMKYRILDFLSGYAYCANINREKLETWIYLFENQS